MIFAAWIAGAAASYPAGTAPLPGISDHIAFIKCSRDSPCWQSIQLRVIAPRLAQQMEDRYLQKMDRGYCHSTQAAHSLLSGPEA
jgi:hypothetical protein